MDTDRCNIFCCSWLLTFMFLPGYTALLCTRSQRQTNNDPSLLTQLDLSKCNISRLQVSDFKLYPNLRILDLSNNHLEALDFAVFQFNAVLEHLDISLNRLHTLDCSSLQFIKGIKYLNMSYNHFETVDLCQEFGMLRALEHIGLSTKEIAKDDFMNITHLELKSVYLGLEDLWKYYNGSLQLLKTEKLHITAPQNLLSSWLFYDAFTVATVLEISQIRYPASPFLYLDNNSRVSTLIFSDIKVHFHIISRYLETVWHSSVKYVSINRVTIIEEFNYLPINVSKGSIESLQIENVIPQVFVFYEHPLNLFSKMLLKNLTLSNAEITYFICPPYPSIFQFLTLTNNGITDGVFQQCDTLHDLQYLNLHNNRLEKLLYVCSMTSRMDSLKHLDVSDNFLSYDQDTCCVWSENLVFLNLSNNKLMDSVFKCLPTSLEVLDLSRNNLQSVSKDIKTLKYLRELNLALNQLNNLPDCSQMGKKLVVLNLDNNIILSPSGEFFQNCQNIKTVSVQNNKFVCNCEIRSFVSSVQKFQGKLEGWPTSYKCELPEENRGIILEEFHLSEISCNVSLLVGIVVGSTLILVLLVCFTCKYFDLPWYIRMIFQWLRKKYRARNIDMRQIQKGKHFHAFVSYSQHDGDWVRDFLIPNLEKEGGSIRVCLHERDFIPGRAIIDNIIHCIEKSFKSIFVLSPNFVQSEWCHYELYFAQHSLFGKNSENLILILLEPIPQYLIPNKYSRLKALMKERTYMEWPKEKGKHGLFWANLRGAIQINLPIEEEELVQAEEPDNHGELDVDSHSISLHEAKL
ncbi:toll-like receptor 1 [Hyperolius riggenbachi]|uniref:toll-like receptor 1 n=1 Tax=Hyperolius riggenbachi TaxID=752182 RepID=UPI0035A2A570